MVKTEINRTTLKDSMRRESLRDPGEKKNRRNTSENEIPDFPGHSISLTQHHFMTYKEVQPALGLFPCPCIRSEFGPLYPGGSSTLFQETFVFMANPKASFRSRKPKQHLMKM